jgi:hypothetical protein
MSGRASHGPGRQQCKTYYVTLPAHFDGDQIRLDVEVTLKSDARLLVTVLDETLPGEALVWQAMKLSETAFARVWDNEEDAVYDDL